MVVSHLLPSPDSSNASHTQECAALPLRKKGHCCWKDKICLQGSSAPSWVFVYKTEVGPGGWQGRAVAHRAHCESPGLFQSQMSLAQKMMEET